MNPGLRRRLLAEFARTAPPLIFGVGAVVAAPGLGHRQRDYARLGIVALWVFVPMVAAAVHMPGTTSGAHINPAVTCSLAVVALVGGALAARASEVIAQPRRAAAPRRRSRRRARRCFRRTSGG